MADDDAPEVYDDEVEETEVVQVAEEAAAYNRPPVGAVIPIRDPEDEPFVFRFEVGPAILIQLLEKLRGLNVLPLEASLKARYPGFYQLFLDGKPVYIGKTARPIGVRMKEHIKTMRGRISLDHIECKFAYVEDPSLVDVAEGALINFFASFGEADWNQSGFGSKTTGYGRAGTRSADWHDLFPAQLDLLVEAGNQKPVSLASLIRSINRGSPITFTIPRKHSNAFNAAYPDRRLVEVTTRPFVEWVEFVESQLRDGWRVQRESRSWYIVPTPTD